MVLSVDVTKKSKDDFNSAPREGAYIHGLFMEGARWDSQSGLLIHPGLINVFFVIFRTILESKNLSKITVTI